MPDVVAFVAAIAARGLAYEAADGVYFDTTAFRAHGHAYGKLRLAPEAVERQYAAFAAARARARATAATADASEVDAAGLVSLDAELGVSGVDVDTGSARDTNTNANSAGTRAQQDLAALGGMGGSTGRFVSASAAARSFKSAEADFALWKKVTVTDTGAATCSGSGASASAATDADEAWWASPWGPGRPGWHIECSAMTAALWGPRLDLHGGGVDLRFPHHCNEIAQGEARFGWAQVLSDEAGCVAAANGSGTGGCGDSHARDDDACVVVRLDDGSDSGSGSGSDPGTRVHSRRGEWCPQWAHTGHLHITGRKMSKSLKNFVTVRELLAAGTSADEFRMLCLQAHYRAGLDYAPERLRAARAAITAVRDFWELVARTVAASPSAVPQGAAPRAAAAAYGAALTATNANTTARSSAERVWDAPLRPRPADLALAAAVSACRADVLAACRNDFDGPRVLAALQDLCAAGRRHALEPAPAPHLLQLAAAETARVLRLLGFRFAGAPDEAAASPFAASASAAAAAGALDADSSAGAVWRADVTAADVAMAHPDAAPAAVREALWPRLAGLKGADAAAALAAAEVEARAAAAATAGSGSPTAAAQLRWPAEAVAPAAAIADALASFRGQVRAAALRTTQPQSTQSHPTQLQSESDAQSQSTSAAAALKLSGKNGAAAQAAAALASAEAAGSATAAVPVEVLRALSTGAAAGGALAARVLALCDEERDVTLPALGFALKDVATASDVAQQQQLQQQQQGEHESANKGYFLRALHAGEAAEMQRALLEAAQARVAKAGGSAKPAAGAKASKVLGAAAAAASATASADKDKSKGKK